MKRNLSILHSTNLIKSKIFHFRGDNIFNESEYLSEEYNSSVNKFYEVGNELDYLIQQYNNLLEEQSSIENYYIKVSTGLSQDSEGFNQYLNKKEQIKKLKFEIFQIEEEMKNINNSINTTNITQLINELSTYQPKISNSHFNLNFENNNSIKIKEKIGKTLISKEFQDSIDILILHQTYSQTKKFFRYYLTDYLCQINQEPNSPKNNLDLFENFILELTELKLNKLQLDLQLTVAKIQSELLIKYKIDQISEGNEYLILIKEEPFNINEIKNNCNNEDNDFIE